MNKFYCEACKVDTKDGSNYKRHCQTAKHTRMVAGEAKPEKVYKCDKCEYSTKIQCNFLKHLRNKHEERLENATIYKCQFCNYESHNHGLVYLHTQKEHVAPDNVIIKLAAKRQQQIRRQTL